MPCRAKHLRQQDREQNAYPNLFYPEVYVLEGGYKKFFNEFKVGFFVSWPRIAVLNRGITSTAATRKPTLKWHTKTLGTSARNHEGNSRNTDLSAMLTSATSCRNRQSR